MIKEFWYRSEGSLNQHVKLKHPSFDGPLPTKHDVEKQSQKQLQYEQKSNSETSSIAK